MLIHLYLPLEEGENVLVDIMMMNTNYDKQYKTEAFVMLKNHISYFMGKNERYDEKIICRCMCKCKKKKKKRKKEDEQHVFA
jgi:hypothetical protein